MAAGGKGFVFVFVVLAENCRITARAKGNNNVRLLRVIKIVVLSLLVLATDDASENGVLKRSGDRFWERAEGGVGRKEARVKRSGRREQWWRTRPGLDLT